MQAKTSNKLRPTGTALQLPLLLCNRSLANPKKRSKNGTVNTSKVHQTNHKYFNHKTPLRIAAAVAQEKKNQRATLRKQREDYKRRAAALKHELHILREQREDLSSGAEPPSPTTKGFLKENNRLQVSDHSTLTHTYRVYTYGHTSNAKHAYATYTLCNRTKFSCALNVMSRTALCQQTKKRSQEKSVCSIYLSIPLKFVHSISRS